MKRLCLVLLPTLALAIYDMKWFDANRWRCPFYNDGRWGIDITQGNGAAGASWPQPLRNFYVFGAGPWVGAVAGGDTLVSVGYNPNSGGMEFGPTLCRYWRQGTGDSLDRIYKYPGDWPPPLSRFPMAPQQSRSEMDLWCCFGDSDPANHPIERPALDIAVAGSCAYVVGCVDTPPFFDGTFDIIDITDPQHPDAIGHLLTQSRARAVAVSGSHVYVVEDSGFCVIDVSDPHNPYQTARCTMLWTPRFAGVTVAGDYAYVAAGMLSVIDVSNPQHPYEAGRSGAPSSGRGVAVAGNYAYVADGLAGLSIIDVSDPRNPFETGSCSTPGTAYDVAVAGSLSYVADGSRGLRVIDVSDPQNPVERGSYDTPGVARGVAVAGSYAYVADDDAGLRVVDISNPQNPTEVGSWNAHCRALSVVVVGNYAYLADGRACLRVVDVSNPQSPREAGYCTPRVGPLGIDVCLTAYGFTDSLARDMFLLKYELTNCSGSQLSSTYFGIMMDGDVGSYADDMTGLILDKLFRVGLDTFRVKNTGYVYDYDNVENRSQYWESGTPGAVAVRLLRAPHGFGLTSFKRLTLGINPTTNRDQYLTMAGYNYRTGQYEPFDSIDALPADKLILLSTGPFDLVADSTVTFYYAVIAAPYGEAGQPPQNRDTTELALRCWWADQVLERVLAVEEPQSRAAQLGQTVVGPTVFNRATGLRLDLPIDEQATVSVYDATGRAVGTWMSLPQRPDSTARLDFGTLPPGIYLVRLQTPRLTETFKVLYLGN
ncbi:MAG: T9SS type A sorting domain-containing protein [candidate division WOR-3 bacterium]